MSDPYQPPSSNVQRSRQTPLYSLHGIVVATVLGSLAAAVVILYLNYRNLGSPALAQKTAVGGFFAYLLLIGIAALLPDSMLIGGVFIVIQTSIAYFAANQLQGNAINYHREQGRAMYSSFRAAGVGLLTGLAILFVFVLVGTLFGMAAAG